MAAVHDNHGGQGIVKALDVERVLLAVVKGRLSNGHGGLTVSYIVRHELVDVCLVRATSALHPVGACPRTVSTTSELHHENLAKLHIDVVVMHDRLEVKVVLVGQVDVPDWMFQSAAIIVTRSANSLPWTPEWPLTHDTSVEPVRCRKR